MYIEDLVIRNHKGTAVIIFYQNGRRMAYCPEDGKRLIIENLDLKEESSILTLVEQKEDFWTSLKDKITEICFLKKNSVHVVIRIGYGVLWY